MGAIRDAIAAVFADAALTPLQRQVAVAQLKGQALYNAIAALPVTIIAGQLAITVLTATIDATLGALTLTLSATNSGIPIPLNNPFIFVNPPTHIADAAGEVVIPTFDRAGTLIGTRRYTEAPLRALRQIVVDAVQAQAT